MHTIHKLVAMVFLSYKPNGFKIVVDHINSDKSDNKASNLQIITQRENCSKDKKGYSSKYIGVSRHKKANKWVSKIRISGKSKYLGLFNSEKVAAAVYQYELKIINHEPT